MGRRRAFPNVGSSVTRIAADPGALRVSGAKRPHLCPSCREAGCVVFRARSGERHCGFGGAALVSSAIFPRAHVTRESRRRDSLFQPSNASRRTGGEFPRDIPSDQRSFLCTARHAGLFSHRALLPLRRGGQQDISGRNRSLTVAIAASRGGNRNQHDGCITRDCASRCKTTSALCSISRCQNLGTRAQLRLLFDYFGVAGPHAASAAAGAWRRGSAISVRSALHTTSRSLPFCWSPSRSSLVLRIASSRSVFAARIFF